MSCAVGAFVVAYTRAKFAALITAVDTYQSTILSARRVFAKRVIRAAVEALQLDAIHHRVTFADVDTRRDRRELARGRSSRVGEGVVAIRNFERRGVLPTGEDGTKRRDDAHERLAIKQAAGQVHAERWADSTVERSLYGGR